MTAEGNVLLLIGAGFSRNWGGWLSSEAFEFLLGCPEIAENARLKSLLWKHQAKGGFEDALAEVQRDRKRSSYSADVNAFQSAVTRMFEAMNGGFSERVEIEFQARRAMHIRTFLTKFDAIFSLNQDLFLEHHYLNDNVMLLSDRRWSGWQIPGMRLQPESVEPLQPPPTGTWVPNGELQIASHQQPLFKLHGSSNWRDRANGSLLIMGGDKARGIESHEILNQYLKEFRKRLSVANARLMVIGYGFRDPHINDVISTAVGSGLKFFVIDPLGSGLARSLNSTRQPGMIQQQSDLEHTFEQGLVGGSRRPISEIFGADTVEHAKVMRFFDA